MFFVRFEFVYFFDGFFTLFADKIKAPDGALCILYCCDIFLKKVQEFLFGKHRIDHAVKHMLIVIVQLIAQPYLPMFSRIYSFYKSGVSRV